MNDDVHDEETHLNKTQARAGSSPGVMRYVLAISLALIIVLFVALLFIWR